MRPELFSIPFVHISIKSYGVMMALGFLTAILLARWRCRQAGENPNNITDFGIYALFFGILGARLLHVFHHWSLYRDNLKDIFAIWSGGLEFLGGFVLAFAVMLFYFRRKKLPIMKYLDILAPSLVLGLAFGRVGCFMNGCCFGAPSDLPWAVRFPAYNTLTHNAGNWQKENSFQYSHPYEYQLTPDYTRRDYALLQLPAEYYSNYYADEKGNYYLSKSDIPKQSKSYRLPKTPADLTPRQLRDLQENRYPMRPIHPAQLYSSVNALLLCLVLNIGFRRRKYQGRLFAVLLILYGCTRFLLETLRNSSPLEFNGFTISQNLGVLSILTGIALFFLLQRFGTPVPNSESPPPRQGKN